MQKFRIALKLIFLTVLTSCDSRTEWSDGNYQVRWIDTPELSLTYRNAHGQIMTLIDPDITGIGANQKLIVVRHRVHASSTVSYFLVHKQTFEKSQIAESPSIEHLTEAEYLNASKNSDWPRISSEFHY
ncbi:hypothetical protein [Undibacterium sp. Ji22W]|uniref:hypothetical protein n=1 Tax=Undibacterium sp. Ji22W TaxID=3413038 RepID=UPI003BF43707